MSDKKLLDALKKRAQGEPEPTPKDVLVDEAMKELFRATKSDDKEGFKEALKHLLEAEK